MLDMLGLTVAVDENVVKIDNAEYIKVVAQRAIYVRLEGRRCIDKSKWEDKVFKQTKSGSECCFPLITFLYPYPVVCVFYVKLAEDFCTTESVECFCD